MIKIRWVICDLSSISFKIQVGENNASKFQILVSKLI